MFNCETWHYAPYAKWLAVLQKSTSPPPVDFWNEVKTEVKALDDWMFVPQTYLGQRRKRHRSLQTLKESSYGFQVVQNHEIPLRPQSWHDFYNALTWLAYPLTKQVLFQQIYNDLQQQSGHLRSRLADRYTCFDEGGVFFIYSANPETRGILENRDLEKKRKLADRQNLRIFGHGLLEVGARGHGQVNAMTLVVEPEPQENEDSLFAQTLWNFNKGLLTSIPITW